MTGIFTGKTCNFAHRGFTLRAPENSMLAFQHALDLGVDGIELDVRTCKTGELIVFHDSLLARLTDGKGFVKNKILSDLKMLRLQGEKGTFNEKIPTLNEVLDLLAEKVVINIEIKTNGLPGNGIEKKVVDLVQKYDLFDSVIISSFNPLVVRRTVKIDQKLMTGYLIEKNFNLRRSEIFFTKMARAAAVHIDKSLAKEPLIRKIRNFGFHCLVWTVNETKQMRDLIDLDVTAIISDRPDLLREELSRDTL